MAMEAAGFEVYPVSLQSRKSHQTPCFVATVYGWAYSYSYLNFASVLARPKSRPAPAPFVSLQGFGFPSHCSCGG